MITKVLQPAYRFTTKVLQRFCVYCGSMLIIPLILLVNSVFSQEEMSKKIRYRLDSLDSLSSVDGLVELEREYERARVLNDSVLLLRINKMIIDNYTALEIYNGAYKKLRENIAILESQNEIAHLLDHRFKLSLVLMELSEFEQAHTIAEISLDQIERHDTIHRRTYQLAHYHNVKSLILLEEERYEEARVHCEKSIALLKKEQESANFHNYYILAFIGEKLGDSDSSTLSFWREAFNRLPKEPIEDGLVASQYIALWSMKARLKSTPPAEKIRLLEQCNDQIKRWKLDYKGAIEVYDLLSKWYIHSNQSQKAIDVIRESRELREKIWDEDVKNQKRVIRVLDDLNAMSLEREKLKSQRKLALSDAKMNRMRFLIALFASIALLLSTIILWRYFKRKRAEMKRELILKKYDEDKLQEKVDQQESDIKNMSLDFTRVNTFLTKTLGRLKAIEKNRDKSPQSMKSVIRAIQAEIKSNDVRNKTYFLCQEYHANFFTNLTTRYPLLSASEKELCGFIRLDMSSKDIADLLDIMPKSVDMKIYRLKEKMAFQSTKEMKTAIHKM